jgi:SAM-dependent methyltransferase
MADEIKAYYDAAAERIADEWYGNDILIPTIKDFLRNLPLKPRILDLGCGPGYESKRMESLGAEVIGIDYSPENIRIAIERCPQCKFYEMDFRLLDDRYGAFDGIFASASLIHITSTEIPEIASRLQKVLRKDGMLLTLMQDGEGKRERWININGNKMHWCINLYTKEMLVNLLKPFTLLRETVLSEELLKCGWRSYLWKSQT